LLSNFGFAAVYQKHRIMPIIKKRI